MRKHAPSLRVPPQVTKAKDNHRANDGDQVREVLKLVGGHKDMPRKKPNKRSKAPPVAPVWTSTPPTP